MNIVENMVALVGNTPLIRLNHLTKELGAEVWVKAEFYNPLFSASTGPGRRSSRRDFHRCQRLGRVAARQAAGIQRQAHRHRRLLGHRAIPFHRARGKDAGKSRQPADSRNLTLIFGRGHGVWREISRSAPPGEWHSGLNAPERIVVLIHKLS